MNARLEQTKNELDLKIIELGKMKSELKDASDKANVSPVKNESDDVFAESSLPLKTTPKLSRKVTTQSQAIARPKKEMTQSTASSKSNTGSSEIRRLPRKSMNETRSSGASSRRGYSGSDQVMGCLRISSEHSLVYDFRVIIS